jgi:hypothetical protein
MRFLAPAGVRIPADDPVLPLLLVIYFLLKAAWPRAPRRWVGR